MFFATDSNIGGQLAFSAWSSGVKGYAMASKISSYVLGILIAVFIIAGIGVIVKHVLDKRSDKKMLIIGILTMVIGAGVSAVLLGVLTGTIFPGEIQKLYDEGGAQGWITGDAWQDSAKNLAKGSTTIADLTKIFKDVLKVTMTGA